MSEQTYRVEGMTCEHCAAAVTDELTAVAEVRGVHVDLDAGTVRVEGDGVSDEAVTAAVEEAGYRVAGRA